MNSNIGRLYVGLLAVVLLGVVVHAPLSVGLGTLFPGAELFIKSWKELLLGVAALLLVYTLFKEKRWGIYNERLFYGIAAFSGLCLLLVPFLYTGLEATLAGLLINLRFFLVFVLVYSAVKLYPGSVRIFLGATFAGVLIVVGFAALQLTVLPVDILKYIGYSEATIMPYMLVDQNPDFVRINSTLRGPNPLGAYMVVVLASLVALLVAGRQKLSRRARTGLFVLAVLAIVVLWATYSRGAALGAMAALGIVAVVVFGGRVSRIVWIGLVAGALLLGGALIAARETPFVSTVILHEDPAEAGDFNSNDEHAASLMDGLERMLAQPFGAGIGSTGSASFHTDSPLIIENQYLFIAHETGWVGLVLFLAVSGGVLMLLWRRRGEWLALAAFSSGVGLMIIGMVLPVWVDDTVSIVWWALAAIALAVPARRKGEENDK